MNTKIKIKHLISTLLWVMGFSHQSVVANDDIITDGVYASESTEPWNQLSVFKLNHEPDRAFYISYRNKENALKPIDPLDPYKHSDSYLSLNGDWSFKYIEGLNNRILDYHSSDLDESQWDSLPVPASWQMFGFGNLEYDNPSIALFYDKNGKLLDYYNWNNWDTLAKNPKLTEHYNPIGYYRKRFNVPASWSGERIFIHFGGVQGGCTYYLNGEELGYSEDGKVPTEFEITRFVNKGENILAMEVMSYSTGSLIELQDATKTSGILQDVNIYCRPNNHIWDYYAKTELSDDLSMASIDLRAFVRGESESIILRSAILDQDGNNVASSQSFIPSESEYGADLELSEYKSTIKIKNPKLWSPDNPYLYQIVITLHSQNDNLDIIKSDLGFRKFQQIDRKLYLNHKPFLMKGVNRHDHDPLLGKAIRPSLVELDARLMKQLNMNFVRNAHHPMGIRWYLMCNRYGIAIIDETNLETHWYMGKIPGDNKNWMPPCVDRIKSMVFRSRNLPAVFIWSPGNEAAKRYHKTFQKMEAEARKWDPSRTFMAEFRDVADPKAKTYHGTVDYISPMYGGLKAMRIALAMTNDTRPFIFCEYSHAFGNSSGHLSDMWDLIRKYDALNGGCIWDWADQTLYKEEPKHPENRYLMDGGEYGTRLSTDNGNADGLVTGNRRLNPETQEVKKAYQNIQFIDFDPSTATLTIENEFIDTNLSDFECSYEITENGKVIESHVIPDLHLKPGANRKLKLKDLSKFSTLEGIVHIRFSVKNKIETPWWPKGYENSWMQYKLKDGNPFTAISHNAKDSSIQTEENGNDIGVTVGDKHVITFSKKNAIITSYKIGDQELILKGGGFTIESALTDTQKYRKTIRKLYEEIMSDKYSYHVSDFKIDSSAPSKVVLDFETTHSLDSKVIAIHQARFEVLSDGSIKCKHSARGENQTRDVARIAAEYHLPAAIANYEYFGRGPESTYPDRYRGGWLGAFEGDVNTVDLEMYSTLQECGNRMDTHWVKLSSKHGAPSLVYEFDEPYSISILPYTQRELSSAKHLWELPKSEKTVFLINAKARGVGNKFANTQLENRNFLKKPVSFGYTIKPISE